MVMFYLLVISIVISSSGYAGTIYEIPINELDYTVETIDGFARLRMSGAFAPFAPGTPELPAVAFTYLLPQKKKLKQVEIIEAQWEKIPGSFYIYPKQHEIVISDEREFAGPEKSIYNSDNVFPPKVIISVHSGNTRGYQLGQIGIVPFRYFPKSGELHRLKKLIISCALEDCEPGVSPTRQTRLAQQKVNHFLSQVVVNRRSIRDLDKSPQYYIQDNPNDLSPTDLPSLLGPPVDLLIITTETQFAGYVKLAHLKKIMGYNTAVRTVTWVRQHYTGVDDAERIRKFIVDAVANWGVLYVLMGGDVLDIPTRWVWIAPLYSEWPVHIVTDHYYADLDGNWNGDGDEKYGEVDDSLDLYPDVFVGRLPTTDNFQINDYIDKLRAYTFPNNTDYQTKALFFTSDFDVSNDAYEMALRLSDHLPPYFTKSFIDERPRGELKDSIHSGFGLVFGLGHGDINNIRVKNNPRENATNYFFDSLANTDYYALMQVITCYTNTFQADCVSKHWLFNAQGGGIAYIGPTSFSEAYLHEEYTAVLIDSFFVCPLAASLAKSKIPYISQAQWENWYRLYQFSIMLLGDPTLALWDSIPLSYSGVNVNPDTICVGVDSVNVSVVPDMAFNVVFYKAGECFVREQASGGVLTVGLRTESAGYLKYAVMARGYIMYIDSVCVVPVEPYIVFSDCVVMDT
ncbi:MAG: C25 family cysteine peptidase, partial [bacterium]